MASPSRRSVLRLLVGGAGVVVAPGLLGAAPGHAAGAPATRLRRSVFQPHVGTSFLLRGRERDYHAVLTSISDIDARAGDEAGFSMLFRTRHGGRPPEGIYAVSHPYLRPVDLYLGPVGARLGTYEAVVNA